MVCTWESSREFTTANAHPTPPPALAQQLSELEVAHRLLQSWIRPVERKYHSLALTMCCTHAHTLIHLRIHTFIPCSDKRHPTAFQKICIHSLCLQSTNTNVSCTFVSSPETFQPKHLSTNPHTILNATYLSKSTKSNSIFPRSGTGAKVSWLTGTRSAVLAFPSGIQRTLRKQLQSL